MSTERQDSSYEGDLPNRTPQAPRSISAAEADLDSAVGRNNAPYNEGSENHIATPCCDCGRPTGAK